MQLLVLNEYSTIGYKWIWNHAIFFGPKMGTFGQKWQKKWHFEWPNQNSKTEERPRNSCQSSTHLVHLLAWKQVDNSPRIARHASMVLTPPPEPAHEPSHVPDQLPLVGELGLPDQGPVTKHPHHLFKISWSTGRCSTMCTLSASAGSGQGIGSFNIGLGIWSKKVG